MIRAALLALAFAALPQSGPISLWDVQGAFGGAAPTQLSEYYTGGAYVAASEHAPGVPASGPISLANFYGASNTPLLTASTNVGTVSGSCFGASTCSAQTGSVTCTATGGTGTKVFAWEYASGTSATAYSPSAATTAFWRSGSVPAVVDTCTQRTGTMRCKVTDGAGVIVYRNVTVTTSHCKQ